MIDLKHPKSQLLALVCTTAIFAAMPVTFDFGGKDGFVSLKPAFALADSDNDNDDGDDDSGSDDNSGSDDDSSDDNGSDNSGSDDDSSDDNGSDDSGSDDDDSSDDDSDDDNSSGAGTGAGSGNGSTSEGNGTKIVKFESTANSLEAVFADGTKVEIANGRYERKDAAGNTVEERRATQADADRILAMR